MLKENERAMIKWMKAYLPKNAESFAKLMKRYGINPFFMKDDKKVFHLFSPRERWRDIKNALWRVLKRRLHSFILPMPSADFAFWWA